MGDDMISNQTPIGASPASPHSSAPPPVTYPSLDLPLISPSRHFSHTVRNKHLWRVPVHDGTRTLVGIARVGALACAERAAGARAASCAPRGSMERMQPADAQKHLSEDARKGTSPDFAGKMQIESPIGAGFPHCGSRSHLFTQTVATPSIPFIISRSLMNARNYLHISSTYRQPSRPHARFACGSCRASEQSG